MINPIIMMGDIMNFHQAIRKSGAQDFVKAVVKEVEVHVNNHPWNLMKRGNDPMGTDILLEVWTSISKRIS